MEKTLAISGLWWTVCKAVCAGAFWCHTIRAMLYIVVHRSKKIHFLQYKIVISESDSSSVVRCSNIIKFDNSSSHIELFQLKFWRFNDFWIFKCFCLPSDYVFDATVDTAYSHSIKSSDTVNTSSSNKWRSCNLKSILVIT